MDHTGNERPPEQAAVKTTIVGGRPPGSGKALGNVPRGIEILVKKAAVDPAFREQLLAQRAAAAPTIGLTLTPSEAAVLQATPAAQLEAIVAQTKVPERHRAAFLGQAAAVMLAALGLTALDTGCHPLTRGVRPDGPPPPAPTQPAEPTSPTPATDTTGDKPAAPPEAAPAAAPSQGVRPDRPMTKGHDASRPPAATKEAAP